MLIGIVLALLSLASYGEINLVKGSQPIVLMSSTEQARLNLDSTQIEVLCKEKAQKLCDRIDKKFTSYTIAHLSTKNMENKSYQASIWQATIEGLSFTKSTLPLVTYPPTSKYSTANEYSFYAGSGVILAAGALTTYSMCLGLDAPPDFFAAKVSAGVSTSLSILSALGGACVRMHRNYQEGNNEASDEECGPSYALPVLVSELWCK